MKKGSSYLKLTKSWSDTFDTSEINQIIKDFIYKRDFIMQWEKDHPIILDPEERKRLKKYDDEKDNSVYGGSYRECDVYLTHIAENERVSHTAIFELLCMYSLRENKQPLNEQEKSILEKCRVLRKQLNQEEENEQSNIDG